MAAAPPPDDTERPIDPRTGRPMTEARRRANQLWAERKRDWVLIGGPKPYWRRREQPPPAKPTARQIAAQEREHYRRETIWLAYFAALDFGPEPYVETPAWKKLPTQLKPSFTPPATKQEATHQHGRRRRWHDRRPPPPLDTSLQDACDHEAPWTYLSIRWVGDDVHYRCTVCGLIGTAVQLTTII